MEAGQVVWPIAVAAHIYPVICRQLLLCAVGVIPDICSFQAPLQGSAGMVEICATKKKERERKSGDHNGNCSTE